ncbi:hypothetical protein ACFLRF_00415 [Candidatus Altiarchaeota archaeon]
MDEKRSRRIDHSILFLLFILFFSSIYQVYDNRIGFSVNSVEFSKMPLPEGVYVVRNITVRKAITLPFLDSGYYYVNYSSDRERMSLYLYTSKDACIQQVLVDKRSYSPPECLKGYRVDIDNGPSPARSHVLKVYTHKVKAKGHFSRSKGLFDIDHEGNAFFWRVLALASLLGLCYLGYLRHSGRIIHQVLTAGLSWLKDNRGLCLLFALAILIRFILMPSYMSVDLRYYAIPYTENFVQKNFWDPTLLDPIYFFGCEECFMSHPPGWAPYLLGLIRWLFGFTSIYYVYLVKFPPLLGDIMVAYVVWDISKKHLNMQGMPLFLTALILFNPAFIVHTGLQGKADSLSLGFLLFALNGLKRKRFAVYYGLSVVSKQLPLLLVPWLIFRARVLRMLVVAGLMVILLISPYLIHDPFLFFERMTQTHLEKESRGFSWMINFYLSDLSMKTIEGYWNMLFSVFIFLLIVFPLLAKYPWYAAGVITYSLFIIFSKVIFEQYLLWCIPFLLITFIKEWRASCLIAYFTVSFSYLLSNEVGYLAPILVLAEWNYLLLAIMAYATLDVLFNSRTSEVA